MKHWWKILGILLILYSIFFGLLGDVPKQPNVRESIRNLYYHVPMWFAMITMFTISFVNAIIYLNKGNVYVDMKSEVYVRIGLLFGFMGLITGMVWANYTWGAPWNNDPKQIGAALCILSYVAYLVLRGSMKDKEKAAKISAVYNIFAFAMIVPFIWILPDSLGISSHPGSGGNVGFSAYDTLDGRMRKIFYPAIIGWILMGVWISSLFIKINVIKEKLYHD